MRILKGSIVTRSRLENVPDFIKQNPKDAQLKVDYLYSPLQFGHNSLMCQEGDTHIVEAGLTAARLEAYRLAHPALLSFGYDVETI
jgi:hypothetical protein